MDEEAIRAVVTRLSRQHPSGGRVIERAAVVAEGADSSTILEWITSHDGKPEDQPVETFAGGLHSGRLDGSRSATASTPRRYLLPPGIESECSS
jgi:hypothetical protein